MTKQTGSSVKTGKKVSKRKKDLWKGFKNRTTDHRPTAKSPGWRSFEKRDIRTPDIHQTYTQSLLNRLKNSLNRRRK